MPDETVDSFIARMARANKMHPYDLRFYIADDDRLHAPISTPRLAAVSGIHPRTLVHAMPELCSPEELAAMPVAGRPRPGTHVRHLCPKCARMPPNSDPRPHLWSRHEDLVCQRHWYWTDATTAVSLANHPDIVHANRRHRRLIRRHGRNAVHHAYEAAVTICQDWYQSFSFEFHRYAQPFRRPPWSGDETAFAAAVYPYAVALTRLLAAPHWRSLILDDHLPLDTADPPDPQAAQWTASCILLRTSPAIRRYTAEVRRTVHPHFGWSPEPHYRRPSLFTAWVIDQLQDRFGVYSDRYPLKLGCPPDTLTGLGTTRTRHPEQTR